MNVKHTYVGKKIEGMMREGEMMRGSRMMETTELRWFFLNYVWCDP